MTFSAWLVGLPAGVPMLIVVGTFVTFAVATTLALRAWIGPATLRRHNDIAGFVFAVLGAVYAVLLAFVVFVVWEQHGHASELAESEALHATALYRTLSAYPDQSQAAPALAALEGFARSVVEQEFPALWRHERAGAARATTATDERLRALWDAIRRLSPATMPQQALFQQSIEVFGRLEADRQQRLIAAQEDLPRVIWLAIVIGGLVTVGYPSLFGHDHVAPTLALGILLAVVVGFVVLVIVRLNYPFLGADRIEPAGYDLLLRLAKW